MLIAEHCTLNWIPAFSLSTRYFVATLEGREWRIEGLMNKSAPTLSICTYVFVPMYTIKKMSENEYYRWLHPIWAFRVYC